MTSKLLRHTPRWQHQPADKQRTRQTDARVASCPRLPFFAQILAAACVNAACEGGWSPSGVGPAERASPELLAAVAAPAPSLENDIVLLPAPESPSSTAETADAAGPRVLYIAYSDGGPQPVPYGTPNYACTGTPTPFTCNWDPGGVEACKRRIQAYLDAAYRDFNLIFTYQRPTDGSFYTSLVTSSWQWCQEAAATQTGVTKTVCNGVDGGISYTLQCGYTYNKTDPAQICAQAIAHEQAHLVGLMHTSAPYDIMGPQVCAGCKLFAKGNYPADGGGCRATQDSYQMMLSALGAWPGGTKPPPFADCSANAPPSVTISTPPNGATVGQQFDVTARASDGCSGVVGGRITIGALSSTADGPGPWTWPVRDLTGALIIKVEATNANGNVGSASITVTGPAPPGSGSTDTASTDAASQADGQLEQPAPAQSSCGCALGAPVSPGAAGAVVATVALALARLRRWGRATQRRVRR